ncbi:fimbrial protein [Photobacterium indicum]|jgi:type 1 fimbria pilin|uniref:Fimbrial-type adhesion domain-containing protein n=1 Tax=Photobacterium indicum TaxID=81447 RepID=A0A2T3L5Y8_9GAMM|nr:fimbrial protein [Photobacterium indicum]PSV45321.1 hypothetical protein C9J47_18640 [Photobacterium indicum]
MKNRFFVLAILLTPHVVYASDNTGLVMNECRPIEGTSIYTQEFTGSVDEAINKPGGIAKGFFEFTSNGGKVPRECKCKLGGLLNNSDKWYDTTYFTATTPLSHSKHNRIQYLDLNDSLSVAMYYWIGKRNEYLDVPFKNEKNTYPELCTKVAHKSGGWTYNPSADTGAKGKIDLRFKKKVVGSTTFSGLVSTLYASLNKNVSSKEPIAQTYLNITVNTPAFCSIEEGSTINIDLGSVASQDMNYGKEPTGYNKRDLNLTFNCNFDGKLDLTMLGKASTLSDFYATTNTDVGIAIERNGNLVIPNKKGNEVPLDRNQVGHFDAKAYPVKTTSNVLTPGDYSGSVNVLIEVL